MIRVPESVLPIQLPTTTGPVVGVRTTRIYCRPVCRPGRAPKPENCVPFPDAVSARAAGYRACKQCRPDELAPNPPRSSPAIRYGMGVTTIGSAFLAMSEGGGCGLVFF